MSSTDSTSDVTIDRQQARDSRTGHSSKRFKRLLLGALGFSDGVVDEAERWQSLRRRCSGA